MPVRSTPPFHYAFYRGLSNAADVVIVAFAEPALPMPRGVPRAAIAGTMELIDEEWYRDLCEKT
jgi:hypothetical protein